MRATLPFIVSTFLVAACSGDRAAPVGRWQGMYESADAVIVARLEIAAGGVVRVSAPNAFGEEAGLTAFERAQARGELTSALAKAWPGIEPLELSFDGRTFRKPGGVAPQLEWDGREMTLIVYPGLKDTIRMRLERVEDFAQ
jgi:hypothetical protein